MIKCKECGNDFEPKNKKGVFCSNKCRQKDYRKGVAELLKSVKNGKIISAKIKKEINKHSAEVVIELPDKKQKEEKRELTAFEIYRNKKMGIK